MMKKIILISTLLHLTFTLLAKDGTNSVGIYMIKSLPLIMCFRSKIGYNV